MTPTADCNACILWGGGICAINAGADRHKQYDSADGDWHYACRYSIHEAEKLDEMAVQFVRLWLFVQPERCRYIEDVCADADVYIGGSRDLPVDSVRVDIEAAVHTWFDDEVAAGLFRRRVKEVE